MSRIFIDRPIFAWVIAIIIMLMGVGAILSLPVAQYPDVAPTQINIRASYPGASAATLESSVTQVLEQQLTGIDGMLYFQSSSSSRGQVSISVILAKGVDPDIAQVQVQNAIQAAISRLPQQVQQQGVRVTKGAPDLLLIEPFLEERDGILWIKDIATEFPRTRILIVSRKSEQIYAERALRAGASGYWMKNSSAEELMRAIRAERFGPTGS